MDEQNAFHNLSVVEIVDRIQKGNLTSLDLSKYLLNEIEEKNKKINAFVSIDKEEVIAHAKLADEKRKCGDDLGALHGIPISLKDVFVTKSLRTTAGSLKLRNWIPHEDATLVKKLKQAGAIVLGKTNTPELAMDTQCENALWGRTLNPHHQDYTCGGSSGGEAAAIASGMSILGFGSDIGGSLRIPAHYCGIVGFKPSQGMVSANGHIPPLPEQINSLRFLSSYGPMAKTVKDIRLAFKVIQGYDSQDILSVQTTQSLDENGSSRELKPPRKILYLDFDDLIEVDRTTKKCMESTIQKLQQTGVHVEKVSASSLKIYSMWRVYGELTGHILNGMLPWFQRWIFKIIGPFLGKDVISRSSYKMLFSRTRSFWKSFADKEELHHLLESTINDADAIICPTGIAPAFKHRKMGNVYAPIKVNSEKVPGNLAAIACTAPFNLTGHPAISIPLAKNKFGLPIGLQLVGKMYQDLELLDCAEWLEGFIQNSNN